MNFTAKSTSDKRRARKEARRHQYATNRTMAAKVRRERKAAAAQAEAEAVAQAKAAEDAAQGAAVNGQVI